MRLIRQVFAFGIVGVSAFVIDYALLVFLTEVVGLHYLVSATISFTVSVIFNYLASMRYVFRHRQDRTRTFEIVVFLVGSLIGLGINDLFMWVCTDLAGVSYLISKIVATIVVAVWNFVTRKVLLDQCSTE